MKNPKPTCDCEGWTKGIEQIDAAISMQYIHGFEYTGGAFVYCPWCGGLMNPCNVCALVDERDALRAEVERLRADLEAVLIRMRDWGAEEDGIPDEAWKDFERAALSIRLRAQHCRQGFQECSNCFDRQCCDHPEHVGLGPDGKGVE